MTNYHHSKIEVVLPPTAGGEKKTKVYFGNETPFGTNYSGPLIGSK